MSLLVALHSPAVGYCTSTESYFIGDHVETHDACDHHCDDHGEPIDHPHHMVLLDAGDFQWSPAVLSVPQFVAIELPDWCATRFLHATVMAGGVVLPANPPPPDVPIFRRDAALRL